ncbi:MAG TPA: NAD(P)H-hydrate dehydratase [bacterium]|nr:NAD(P)H-hydrate dehydratase [bacterium]
MKLGTAADMKRIDESAVKDRGLTIPLLMERAGEAVVRTLRERYGDPKALTIGVLCGRGHNGGDGLVAARLLKQAKASVVAVLLGGPEDLAAATLGQYEKAKAAKVPILPLTQAEQMQAVQWALEECDLFLDALYGTGLSRPLEGLARDLVRHVKTLGRPVVAVDIPSGLSADTGAPLGEVLPARQTVTFGLRKVGFHTPLAASFTGEVVLDDLGFPPDLLTSASLKNELTEPSMVRASLPQYDENTHKGTRGRVLVVAGATGLTGAATLCAYGAQRIGAGLVTVACPQSLIPILGAKLTEPMSAPVPEVEGGFLSVRASGRILYLAANVNSVVIGPGIGRHRETGLLVREILTKLTVPMVVDADALYLLGGQMDVFKAARAPVVITPHPGEAAWLLKTHIGEVESNRVGIAKKIAESYNVVVVLKGRFTVIASPQGEVRINPTGNRGLATGGTGDVLAGIIGGLLAQRLSPFDAASTGAYLHGLAGEKASRRLGPDGLLAGDLLPVLPRLLRQLRETTQETPWPPSTSFKTNGKPSSSSSKSGNPSSTTTSRKRAPRK